MSDTPVPAAPESAPATPAPKPSRRREAQPVLERLFQLHPKLFGARFLPLKLGIFEDLLARHPGEFTKDDLKTALSVHARSTRYLEAMASGARRHDLDGKPVEPVAPEHVHHAVMEVYRRRQARDAEGAGTWLRKRLLQVAQASGLTKDDYVARVHAKDDASLAALDDVYAELGARNAKREAVRRAYEASGKGVEEFASMYGLDAAAVRDALR